MVGAGILKEKSKPDRRDGGTSWNNNEYGLVGVNCFVAFVVATQCPAREEMENRRQTGYSESRLGPQEFVYRGSFS